MAALRKEVFVVKSDLSEAPDISERLNKQKYFYAFKVADDEGKPPSNPTEDTDHRNFYSVGYRYTENNYSTDHYASCAKGLNVATLEWVLKNYHSHLECSAYRLFITRIKPKNVVCVPLCSGGKFRVKEFDIIQRVTWDRLITRADYKDLTKDKY